MVDYQSIVELVKQIPRTHAKSCKKFRSEAQLYTCQRDGSVQNQGTRADPDPAHPWPPKRDRTAEPNK